jgi:hypothetical protein
MDIRRQNTENETEINSTVLWDVIPCGPCKNRRFGGTLYFHDQGDNNRWARNNVSSRIIFLPSVLLLLVTGNVVPNSPIHVTLMMEAIRFSETAVLIRATRHHIPEDGILLLYLYLNRNRLQVKSIRNECYTTKL